MQDYGYGYMPPCMQTMAMPAQQTNPMSVMADNQLESMYPNVYNIVNPVVEGHCNNMNMQFGTMHNPTNEQLEAMTDDIMKKVEPEVTKALEKESGERQLGFGGRRLLRNLIGILLIRNLLDRRRRPFFGSPGFFPVGPFGGFSSF